MGISPDIVTEAIKIISKAEPLPAFIVVGGAKPIFVVGEISDSRITTHTTILYNKKNYKIGTLKNNS